ncbi:MAG: hypothetical protein R6X25_10320 [Candidatus Krumholzibacteriia bacterium]
MPWMALVIMLAGANLARITGRGVLVTSGAVLALAAAALAGLTPRPEWVVFAAVLVITATVVALWNPLAVRGGPRRVLLALVVLAAAVVALASLASAPTAAAAGWLWAAAFLALADPATRVLVWVMRGLGKPLARAVETFGRGEAIGVLERWMAVVVIARGDYAAMAFILAAKALARHKRFEDADFAEYFLVGTLASLLLAIAVAEAYRLLGLVP